MTTSLSEQDKELRCKIQYGGTVIVHKDRQYLKVNF